MRPTTCPTIFPRRADRLLGALAPDLLVFSKLDLWPELATRAASSGATVALVAATVSAGSGRLRWPARALLHAGYAAVSAAGTIAGGGRRAARAPGRAAGADPGPRRSALRQRGRPGGRGAARRALAPVRTRRPDARGRLHLAAPTRRCCSRHSRGFARAAPEARLILVPHEPTVDHLAALDGRAARAGLPVPARLSTAEGPVAAAGGGPGRRARHALWGRDHGVRRRRVRAGGAALGAGAGRVGRAGGVRAQLAEQPGRGAAAAGWRGRGARAWAGNRGNGVVLAEALGAVDRGRIAPDGAGGRARAIVSEGLGAARRSAEMLAELISSRSPRR